MHGVRDGEIASAVLTTSDVYDNETSMYDAGDNTDVGVPATLAISPGGVLLRRASVLRLSSDGGGTWTSITGSGAWAGDLGLNAGVCSAGGEGQWILAKNQLNTFCGVFYTPDNGATWVDKTGNIKNYFTTDFSIQAMKAIL